MDWLVQLFQLLTAWIPRLHYMLPSEAGARITLGRYTKAVGPGWWWYWPLVQRMVWTCVVSQVLDLPPQTVFTKDRKQVTISLTVRFSVPDAVKALLGVHDYDEALKNVARGAIAEYVNQHTLEQCADIQGLMAQAEKVVQREVRGWGLKVERIYVDQVTEARVIRLLMNTPIVSSMTSAQ